MDKYIHLFDSISLAEINDLLEKFKESQNVYMIRKEAGLTFKEFRRLAMLLYNNKQ